MGNNRKKDNDDSDSDVDGGIENKTFEFDSVSQTMSIKPSIREKFKIRIKKIKEEKDQGVSIRELVRAYSLKKEIELIF